MPRLFLFALLVAGCATAPPPSAPDPPADPPTLRDQLIGRWAMTAVYDRGVDVTDEHNPAGDRYITLYADGTFESGGQPYGRNSGRWILDADRRTLGLDSDLGPEDDSRWVLSVRGDTMEWDGDGSGFARRFRITSRRDKVAR